MTGEEINNKYPVLNNVWKFNHTKFFTEDKEFSKYDGYYYAYRENFEYSEDGTFRILVDPWFRDFYNNPTKRIIGKSNITKLYSTSVEGVPVLLLIYMI